MHNYHDVHKWFPQSDHRDDGRGCDSLPGYNVHARYRYSWGAMILPMMEQQAVYDNISFSVNYNVAPSNAIDAVGATIVGYLCPSDPQTEPRCNRTGGINNGGPNNMDDLGRSNMAGVADSVNWECAANWGTTRGDGILYNWSTIKIGHVLDGTSNTFLVGEVTGGEPGSYTCNYWSVVNSFDTASGINGINTYPGGGTWNFRRQSFSSYHPGGCNFLYADGSVHFVPETINAAILHNLTTRMGKESEVEF